LKTKIKAGDAKRLETIEQKIDYVYWLTTEYIYSLAFVL